MLVISDAMGMFIPSNISREGIKTFLLWKYIGKSVDSFTSVFFDRFNGLFALTGIAFICSLMSSDMLNSSNYIYLSGALFGFCVLAYSMIFLINNSWIFEKIQSIKLPFFHKLKSKLSEIATSLSNFTKHKRTLFNVIGISIVVQLLRIFFIFCMTIALGIHIPVLYLLVILPITMLLLMLPISVGGIGIQEAAYIYFLGPFGVAPEECVALSLLCYTSVILWLLIGWSVYAKEGIAYRNGDTKN
jgi:uncharacterized protein (TIRG00374 family)